MLQFSQNKSKGVPPFSTDMSCELCEQPITPTCATTSFSCCPDSPVHSQCFGNRIVSHFQYGALVLTCLNGHILYTAPQTHYNSHQVSDDQVAILAANPAVKAEVKEMKKAMKLESKARTVFSKVQRQALTQYKQDIADHVQAIKAARQAAMNGLKATPSYKEYTKHRRRLTGLIGACMKRHTICRRGIRKLLGMTNISYYRSMYGLRAMNYVFGIRIR